MQTINPGAVGVITSAGENLYMLTSAPHIMGDAPGHDAPQVLAAFAPIHDASVTHYLPLRDFWLLLDAMP